VSNIGWDEEGIHKYIRRQEQEDERLDQLAQWKIAATEQLLPRVSPRKRTLPAALNVSQI